MDKKIITISLDKNTTPEEIKEIRSDFKANEDFKDCLLNIIVSGHDDIKDNLTSFLLSCIL